MQRGKSPTLQTTAVKGIWCVKKHFWLYVFLCLVFCGLLEMVQAKSFIPPSHPHIQYLGRWDKSDSLHYRYSWPGVRIQARFTGTSIGIRLADSINYFNVILDGAVLPVFHGKKTGLAEYILAERLRDTVHTVSISRRNITFGDPYTFGGLVLDEGAMLLEPPPLPKRKIEFIGDSFTAGESDEATEQSLPGEARFPVTNIDRGFAPLVAHYFQAQYTTTCRSGSGLVCDWQGNETVSLPKWFDRVLMEREQPKWNFREWIPDVVVICLGLNDHSGLRGPDGKVPEVKSRLFRDTYHDFCTTLRRLYPGVVIVAVAAFPEWIRTNVRQVVDEEQTSGKRDIFYATFDEFTGGYVANGHPTVETHRKMAQQLIETMKTFQLFKSE